MDGVLKIGRGDCLQVRCAEQNKRTGVLGGLLRRMKEAWMALEVGSF